MDLNTVIRVVAGVMFVVVLAFLVLRRKKKSA